VGLKLGLKLTIHYYTLNSFTAKDLPEHRNTKADMSFAKLNMSERTRTMQQMRVKKLRESQGTRR
jgi:hypothetical protein